jgi:hypothetical protein
MIQTVDSALRFVSPSATPSKHTELIDQKCESHRCRGGRSRYTGRVYSGTRIAGYSYMSGTFMSLVCLWVSSSLQYFSLLSLPRVIHIHRCPKAKSGMDRNQSPNAMGVNSAFTFLTHFTWSLPIPWRNSETYSEASDDPVEERPLPRLSNSPPVSAP